MVDEEKDNYGNYPSEDLDDLGDYGSEEIKYYARMYGYDKDNKLVFQNLLLESTEMEMVVDLVEKDYQDPDVLLKDLDKNITTVEFTAEREIYLENDFNDEIILTRKIEINR